MTDELPLARVAADGVAFSSDAMDVSCERRASHAERDDMDLAELVYFFSVQDPPLS